MSYKRFLFAGILGWWYYVVLVCIGMYEEAHQLVGLLSACRLVVLYHLEDLTARFVIQIGSPSFGAAVEIASTGDCFRGFSFPTPFIQKATQHTPGFHQLPISWSRCHLSGSSRQICPATKKGQDLTGRQRGRRSTCPVWGREVSGVVDGQGPVHGCTRV